MNPAIEIVYAEKYLQMYDDKALVEKTDLIKALSLKWFRLNALYKIKDRDGRRS